MKKLIITGLIILTGVSLLLSFSNSLVPESRDIQELIVQSASMPPVPGSVHMNLTYTHNLSTPKTLDIYEPLVPFEQGNAPLIVFFHGGSWIHGDKVTIRIIDRFLDRMRKAGYFVAGINYSTSILQGLGGPVKNGEKSVKWLRERAGEYGFNPDNIALYGVSAGGHIALMTETLFRKENCISMVLAECAPSDMAAMARGEAFESSKLLSLLPEGYLDRYSPVSFISPDMAPVLIYHGDIDDMVHVDQAYRLYERIINAGGNAELEIYENGTHAFLGMSDNIWYQQETRALKFMEEHLK